MDLRFNEDRDGYPRVLLVDDNADLREYVRRLLAEHFEVEVADDGGRDIHEHLFPAHLVGADVLPYDPADPVQPATLTPPDERRFELSDEHVFKVGQDATRLDQPAVRLEDLADQRDGKVVEWQAGNNVIVQGFAGKFLHRPLHDSDLVAVSEDEDGTLEPLSLREKIRASGLTFDAIAAEAVRYA